MQTAELKNLDFLLPKTKAVFQLLAPYEVMKPKYVISAVKIAKYFQKKLSLLLK